MILAILLFAYGFYWIGLLPLAGSVLIVWIAYYIQQHTVQRVHELEQSRDHVVDDAAARLRRIERDLHDGPQAQMVAVAMKLGLAQEKLAGAVTGTGPADLARTLELVEAAHRGAKEAIVELRELARGIHPSVLDQGLGTALTTLAARSGVPVELVTDLPERPSAAIETIAYFCAAATAGRQPPRRRAHHPHPQGTRRARADGRRPLQRSHRRRPGRLRARGRKTRGQHLQQARPGRIGHRPPPGPGRPALPGLLSSEGTGGGA